MAKIKWTLPALDDVEDLKKHIATSSEKYSILFIKEIFEAVDQLEEFPKLGKIISQKFTPPIRQILVDNHKILYRYFENETLEILTVIHGSQQVDIDKLVFELESSYNTLK